jgi:hypothetical protein
MKKLIAILSVATGLGSFWAMGMHAPASAKRQFDASPRSPRVVQAAPCTPDPSTPDPGTGSIKRPKTRAALSIAGN